jgi:hypothetical protein
MELNKIKDGLFELIDTATGYVIAQGTFDYCLDWMCELERSDEQRAWLANEI